MRKQLFSQKVSTLNHSYKSCFALTLRCLFDRRQMSRGENLIEASLSPILNPSLAIFPRKATANMRAMHHATEVNC